MAVRRGLCLFEQEGDRSQASLSVLRLADGAARAGDLDLALARYGRAADAFAALGLDVRRVSALLLAGLSVLDAGDAELAEPGIVEAIAVAERVDDGDLAAVGLIELVRLARMRTRLAQAAGPMTVAQSLLKKSTDRAAAVAVGRARSAASTGGEFEPLKHRSFYMHGWGCDNNGGKGEPALLMLNER